MSWIMAAILSICGILSILLLAYLSGRNFALGVLHQVVDIVKKMDQQATKQATKQAEEQAEEHIKERRTNEKK